MTASRVRRKTETRERLERAALECFSEHGVHATQVGDIARRAGVAHGTFYVHFQTKQQLLAELVERDELALVAELVAPKLAVALATACLVHWQRERELFNASLERWEPGSATKSPLSKALAARLYELAGKPARDIAHAELVGEAIVAAWKRIAFAYLSTPRFARAAAARLMADLATGALGGVISGSDPE